VTHIDGFGRAKVETVTEGAVVTDVGDHYAVNFPALGTSNANFAGSVRRGDISISPDFASQLPPNVRERFAESHTWSFPPVESVLHAEILNSSDDDSLARSLTPPENATRWRWSGSDGLVAKAVVERPAIVSKKERKQFFAAVLLGIAGGFLVWFLDLLREAARSWVRKRDQVPDA
jgi:hypothetical protein